MSKKNIFQEGFQLTKAWVSRLGETNLDLLMHELLCAQSQRCGAPVTEVRSNTQTKAPDGGCDGWSGLPTQTDPWLGESVTCWQFKAGTAGQPSKLKGEIKKPIPSKTLADGGRFVLVAPGSKSGKDGENERLAVLIDEARELKLPTDKIDVIGCERLQSWCNQHPGVVASWGHGTTALTISEWQKTSEHQTPWAIGPELSAEVENLRNRLTFKTGDVRHFHVWGKPGVGKTRFALGLCDGATWNSQVVYLRQATNVEIHQIISGCRTNTDLLLVLVVDEFQLKNLIPVREMIDQCDGRLRLISIGDSRSPDPRVIPSKEILPLEESLMNQLIHRWYPQMPFEYLNLITNFASGFVKLGRLAADAIMVHSDVSFRYLLSRDQIKDFLNRMLGKEARRCLHVIAIVSEVGWRGERSAEGKMISEYLGLDWGAVQAEVQKLDSLYGIAPLAARLRYISPEPLAVHLALEAWESYPDLLKSLANVLPSEELQDCYYKRLADLASNSEAAEFGRTQLDSFATIEDFYDANEVRRWVALSNVNRSGAAAKIASILMNSSIEARLKIAYGARRALVDGLVQLAWSEVCFADAAIALAFLADAENDTSANNASREFLARFEVASSGTSASYLKRFETLCELLTLGVHTVDRLALVALSQVGRPKNWKAVAYESLTEVKAQAWWPSREEWTQATNLAISKMLELAKERRPWLSEDFKKAVLRLTRLTTQRDFTMHTSVLIETICQNYPELQDTYRFFVIRTLEKLIGSNLYQSKTIDTVFALHKKLEDESLEGKIRYYFMRDYDMPRVFFEEICGQLALEPQTLGALWPWLTSESQETAWKLGFWLAETPPHGIFDQLFETLAPFSGSDLRFVSFYLVTRQKQQGGDWLEDWLRTRISENQQTYKLLFDLCLRPQGHRLAPLVAETLALGFVDANAADHVNYGAWASKVSRKSAGRIVGALIASGHVLVAQTFVARRIESKPNEFERWQSIALDLVTRTECIPAGRTNGHYWEILCKRLLPAGALSVAESILTVLADMKKERWPGTDVVPILNSCLEADSAGVWALAGSTLEGSEPGAVIFLVLRECSFDGALVPETIMSWVSENPETRAHRVAAIASKQLGPESLATKLLSAYGQIESVRKELFIRYVSGRVTEPISQYWLELANGLSSLSESNSNRKVRNWAREAIDKLQGWSAGALQDETERQRRQCVDT